MQQKLKITRLLLRKLYGINLQTHSVFAFFATNTPHVSPLKSALVYLVASIFREIRPLQKEIKGSLQM